MIENKERMEAGRCVVGRHCAQEQSHTQTMQKDHKGPFFIDINHEKGSSVCF